MTDTLEDQANEGPSEESQKEAREAILVPLRATHRFVKWWEIAGYGLVVCRRLKRQETLTFTKSGAVANKVFEASGDVTELTKVNETVVKTTCVWPTDREILGKIFEEYPAWSGAAAVAVSQLSDQGITEGKD